MKVFSGNDEKPLEIAARDGGIFMTGNKEILLNAGQQMRMSSYEDLHFVVKNNINVRVLFLIACSCFKKNKMKGFKEI